MLFPEESYAIMGCCFEVHNRMGSGFLEAVYQECLEIELSFKGIPFIAQPEIPLAYREQKLKKRYQPDFICLDRILLEIKVCDQLRQRDEAQMINYLHGSQLRLGILINFGGYPKLEYKRLALTAEGADSIDQVGDVVASCE